jgi:hypothetical protein
LYSLALLLGDGEDLVEIDGITEGEARWMASVLFVDFVEWFTPVENQ